MVMGRLLNLKHRWLNALIGKVTATYAESYPELVENSERIFGIIEAEQKKFEGTLEKGIKEFVKLSSSSSNKVTGTDAFNLYQSYGFPWELTKELVEQTGQTVDKIQFEEEFKKHQELSRTASAGQFKGGLASHSEKNRSFTHCHSLNERCLKTSVGRRSLAKRQ
jgi:alanyl-tRNA synthetase